MNTKSELRASMKALRDSLDQRYRQIAERSIHNQLNQLPEVRSAKTIATYISYGSETNTHLLILQWLSLRKRIVVPKVTGGNIVFSEIAHLDEAKPGYKEIPEPPNEAKTVDSKEIDVCIVPGLAFDIQGHRLGYGKGFYDRFLQANPFLLSIGICFTNQLLYEISHTETDFPVKRIITDTINRFTFP